MGSREAVLANGLELTLERVDDHGLEVVDGTPEIFELVLGRDPELGIWEMTPGTILDVEIEEFYVVLRGAAVVETVDGERHALSAGSTGFWRGGEATRWTVTETLRKAYFVADTATS